MTDKYLPHQISASKALNIMLNRHGIAYCFGQPRSGKTRTSIHLCENAKVKRILVLTPKNAIPGWKSELKAVDATKQYTVTNYEQAKKLSPKDYDFAIIDEAHRLGRTGKPTQRVKEVRELCYNLPALFLSGTPIIESPLAIYYQFCITKHSPFKEFKTFYTFFRKYGIPDPMWVGGRSIEAYKKYKPELLDAIEPYVVRMTQADAGISVQAEDKVHVVQLSQSTKEVLDTIRTDGMLGDVAFESDMAERLAVHQIEFGALKVGDEYRDLPNQEVIDYIKATWGDSANVACMVHYKSTRMKMEKHFKRMKLFSSTAHAEGVSLADFEHFIIVGTCFSGAKAVQRRERGININKKTGSVVNHILTDGGISQAVYDAVSEKKDFNLSMYRKVRERE